MTRRLSIFVLVYLLTASPSLAQAPWVQANMKPFDPWIGVTFWIDPAFAAQEPFLLSACGRACSCGIPSRPRSTSPPTSCRPTSRCCT